MDSLIDKQINLQNCIDERRRQLQLNLKEERNYSLTALAGYCLNTCISFREEEEPNASRYEYKLVIFLWRVTLHPLYRAFFIILIICDVGVLSNSDNNDSESNEEHAELLNQSSMILFFSNIAFLIELIFKLIAFEWRVFLNQPMNIMDLVLSIVFVTLLIIDQNQADTTSIHHETLKLTNQYAFLTTIRALRLIMVAQINKSIKILLECVNYTFSGIGNFLALLGIFLYVFSLLGM